MSFPISPVDGQTYKDFIFNSTLQAWEKDPNNVYRTGMVIQVERGYYQGFTSSTGAGYTPTPLKVEITPIEVGSKFFVVASLPINARPASNGCGIAVFARNKTQNGVMSIWGIKDSSYIQGGYMYNNAASDLWGQAVLNTVDIFSTYSKGDILEFQIYGTSQGPGADGSTEVRFGHDYQQGDITIMEIKQ